MNNLLVIISDTHIGSNTAISPSKFTIHNRDTLEAQVLQANRLQAWVLSCWTDFWDYVYLLRGKGRKAKKLIVVHCGDVIDGNHHGSMQLVQEVSDQIAIARELLEPIVFKADKFFGILGTGAHAGQDNSDEIALYKSLGIQYGQQFTIDIDGVIHDFAHHGRAGRRAWTSSAANIATEVMIDYASCGMKPPNFIWRGHNHLIDDSGCKLKGTRAISLPSWQLKTSYGWRACGNTIRSDIGGMIVLDGVLDDSHSRYVGQPDERKIIKI